MKKTIRLACMTCDRDDLDGITAAQLGQAIKAGWRNVERVQGYRQSCKTYDNTQDEPPGFSAFDWWTHLGQCPECAKAESTS